MYIEKLSALINVRNYLVMYSEHLTARMSKDDRKNLHQKILDIEKSILDQSLKLDPEEDRSIDISDLKRTFTSTADVDRVAEVVVNQNGTMVVKADAPINVDTKKKSSKKAAFKRAYDQEDSMNEDE